jgi:uncharacterized protein YPO0396
LRTNLHEIVPRPSLDAGPQTEILAKSDDAIKQLRRNLKDKAGEAFQIIAQYLKADAEVKSFNTESKQALQRMSKGIPGSSEEKETEEFLKHWKSATTRKEELTAKLIEACRHIRTGLFDDGQPNDGALTSLNASPIISRTGVTDLYDCLNADL